MSKFSITSNSLTTAKAKADAIPDRAPVDNESLIENDWQLRLVSKGVTPDRAFGVLITTTISSIIFLTVAATTSSWLFLTVPLSVASILATVASAVVTFSFPASTNGYHSTQRKQKAAKKAYKKWVKQLDFKDSVQGWRPREGAPHPNGRTDTHNRFLVGAEQRNGKIYLTVNEWVHKSPIDNWKYSAGKTSYGNNKVWQRAGNVLFTTKEITDIEKSVGESNYTNSTCSFVFENDEEGLLQMQLVAECLREYCAEKERALYHNLLEEYVVAEEETKKETLAENYIQAINQLPSV